MSGLSSENMALVSCIMPTRNRRAHVQEAIACFLQQTYTQRELIVLDDGTDSVSDLCQGTPGLHYYHFRPGLSLGTKRNLACEMAQGVFLCTWDDDDWSAPWRLAYQAEALRLLEAGVCGLDAPLHWNEASGEAWRSLPLHGTAAALWGATLMMRRTHWERHPFLDTNLNEEAGPLDSHMPGTIVVLPRADMMIMGMHGRNTSWRPSRGGEAGWQRLDAGLIAWIQGTSH